MLSFEHWYFCSMVAGKPKNTRVDGRSFSDFREIKFERGFIGTAEGSASVTIGNTKVIAAIKAVPGDPYTECPDEGVLITSAELRPMSAQAFNISNTKENAIELARIVDRGIRESGCIDLNCLCIANAKRVWILFLDIHVLEYDGNLIDAAGMAAIIGPT